MLHCLNVDIAKRYGVNAAILLDNLHSIIKPETEFRYNCELRFNNNGVWAKISIAKYRKIMPYMTERKIRKAVKLLLENGLILKSKLSMAEFDGTNWYAITDKGLKLIFGNNSGMRS